MAGCLLHLQHLLFLILILIVLRLISWLWKKYRKESFEDSFVKTLIRAGILTILDIMWFSISTFYFLESQKSSSDKKICSRRRYLHELWGFGSITQTGIGSCFFFKALRFYLVLLLLNVYISFCESISKVFIQENCQLLPEFETSISCFLVSWIELIQENYL